MMKTPSKSSNERPLSPFPLEASDPNIISTQHFVYMGFANSSLPQRFPTQNLAILVRVLGEGGAGYGLRLFLLSDLLFPLKVTLLNSSM